jgi:DNA-binding beta-propeller fold protein YncE
VAAAAWLLAAAAPARALAFGPLSSFGSTGESAGQMDHPEGIDIATDGAVYIADLANNRVDVFAPDGAFRFAFGKDVNPAGGDVCTLASGCRGGTMSGDAGGISLPEDVAIGADGAVYVSDSSNARIDVFAPNGAFQFAFGKGVNSAGGDVCTASCKAGVEDESAASLSGPTGVAIAPDRSVFVANSKYHRVDVFSAQGTFLYAFGKGVNPAGGDVCTATSGCRKGSEGGEAGSLGLPFGVEVVDGATVLVADLRNHRVDDFSPQGTFVAAFGKNVAKGGGDICLAGQECQAGSFVEFGAGELKEPWAIAPAGPGAFYVSDAGANRVSEYSLSSGFVRAFGAGVIDGSEAFEECTAVTKCEGGNLNSRGPGAITLPSGLAIDCRGALYVSETVSDSNRIERFGEAGTPLCVPPNPPPAGSPSNRFKFGKLKLNRRKGTATLTVVVPGPGRLTLKGRGVRRVTAMARHAGNVRLLVRAVGAAKRTLARTGTAKLKALVTYAPTGGTALTRPRSLRLKQS